MFQHTAARRRLRFCFWDKYMSKSFNTQPPEGGWTTCAPLWTYPPKFQHTAARRRLDRPARCNHRLWRFNTQPPEGGCFCGRVLRRFSVGFNTQPPEGGCGKNGKENQGNNVSTHSRPKAAGAILPIR